ncbi:RluA family pseudouridine synthase [Spirulina sp. CS-785/01]|uniref:RluA family pseudouridine synthase n=1 Tax=Spirulina sp. CS-785/01 TaxID=3021716 RepID=UPI00232BC171|nr:RluA family pseudouridine synthase [Spirulina sp. CS-785/01]MDB9314473.1 RluA family pseudouridine synthase [Spirulina sp. CS-785/01]
MQVQVTSPKERLDRYLAQTLPQFTRSRLQKLIEQGNITHNGKICTAKKTPVQQGDTLEITIPPTQPLGLIPENIPLDILYEDDALIILNKPAGLVVHPSPGHPQGTLVNALLYHCDQLAGIGGVERPGIVHRLDKDTTGAIMVAKTDIAHQTLQKQIQDKTAQREYLGIVYGSPDASEGTINAPIGRHPVDRKKQAIVEKGGRVAITHWHIRERLGNYTLMQFRLETGRTHQIRVHTASMNHPIVGDKEYGPKKQSLGVNVTGQVLHAYKLGLYHPVSGEKLEVTAPPPAEFETLLRVLRRRYSSKQ